MVASSGTPGLPHARGGVSVWAQLAPREVRSSPRTWGCFQPAVEHGQGQAVFPTHVGVFLSHAVGARHSAGLPHARGGVSGACGALCAGHGSSPRTWGCFHDVADILQAHLVFPTHVGVFPQRAMRRWLLCRLPHARGGVSDPREAGRVTRQSSPRTWGCFYPAGGDRSAPQVFPTHVGVFLSSVIAPSSSKCLPHARGGVSTSGITNMDTAMSSPRTWGCFRL